MWETVEAFIKVTVTKEEEFAGALGVARGRGEELWIRARRATRAPYARACRSDSVRGRARRSSTGGEAASPDRAGRLAAQQVGAGIGERDDAVECVHQNRVDAVEPCLLVPLEQPVRANGPTWRCTAWKLVSVPPIRLSGIGVGGEILRCGRLSPMPPAHKPSSTGRLGTRAAGAFAAAGQKAGGGPRSKMYP